MSSALIRLKHKKVMLHISAGRYDEAKILLEQLCHTDNRNAQTWFLLGAVNGQQKLYIAAIECGLKAIQLQPDFSDAHYNLAQAYMHLGHLKDAAQTYQKILLLDVNHSNAMHNLAYVHELQNNYVLAIELYRKTLAINPYHSEACNNLGNLLIDIGNADEGMIYLKQAITLDPYCEKTHINLGYAFYHQGKLDDATDIFERLAKLASDNTEALLGKAMLLEKAGKANAAFDLVQSMFDAGMCDGRVVLSMARVANTDERKQVALGLLEILLQQHDHDARETQPVHLNLGRLFDELGEPDKAFPHFKRANQLRPVYCEAKDSNRQMDEIIHSFTYEVMQQSPHANNDSDRPIFIVGMPRSGTSLIEQILSSHPQVYGGGEIKEIEYIAKTLPDLMQISESCLNTGALRYLKHIDTLDAEAKFVTDKMPHNFMHLGIIQLLLPNARIIHCKRNPADTCLSIYFHDFNASHGYATDLENLGEHYQKYVQMMQHWKSILKIPIFDIQYEELLEDQETVTRNLLKFCKLDWDSNCLKFHESKRVVNTFSYDQVRRPLYKKAMNRWQAYQHHIGPLLEKLGMAP